MYAATELLRRSIPLVAYLALVVNDYGGWGVPLLVIWSIRELWR